MRRLFVALALLAAAGPLGAFDNSDIGAYQAIDQEGNLTDKVFRVIQKSEGWRIEDRQEDGSWLDVTCQGGCPLEEAGEAEIQYYFKAVTPPGVTNHCLHNQAFAFCRIERKLPGQREVGHALVVIVEGEAFPIRLKPLGPPGDDPDAPPGDDRSAPAPLEEA